MAASLTLRLVFVVLCIAGLSAAQSCPAAGSANAYHPTVACPAYDDCATRRCACFGSTYNPANKTCTSFGSNCTGIKSCQQQFVVCLATAAGNANAPTCLGDLRTALMAVYAGGNYSNSTLKAACAADTCAEFQATSLNCTVPDMLAVCEAVPANYSTTAPPATNATTPAPNATSNVTVAPITTVTAQCTLGGGYSGMTVAQVGAVTDAFDSDATTQLKTRVKTLGWTRGSLTITFQANVTDTAAFGTALNAALSNTTWLAATKAAFIANGGTGEFSLIGFSYNGQNTTAGPSGAPIATKSAPVLAFAWSALLAVLVAVLA